MQAQIKKIYTILAADSSLQTLLGGTGSDKKIYPAISDQFEAFPCVTYEVIGSSWRTVPINVQDITLEMNVYSKTSKQNIEDIFSRVNTLLNYYFNTVQDIVYVKLTMETDMNETDRQLFRKVLRYQIWARN